MVEIISPNSRVTDAGFPIYQNQNGNRPVGQIAPNGRSALSGASSPSDGSGSQDAATVISFSAAALDRLTAMQSEAATGISMARFDRSMTSEEADQRGAQLSNSFAADKVKVELSYLNRLEQNRDNYAAALKRLEASYAKMRDTPPKAAVTLNAADTAKALQMLKDAGRILTIPGGKEGSYIFGKDGIQYNFKGDGTVTARQAGVATSVEAQTEMLAMMKDSMSHISDFLTDTSARREALTTQRDALLAKLTPVADA
jgi:hypothetical protein